MDAWTLLDNAGTGATAWDKLTSIGSGVNVWKKLVDASTLPEPNTAWAHLNALEGVEPIETIGSLGRMIFISKDNRVVLV